ncbi:unnamed protein product [Caenorhabditis bovis]|uniref:C2H2-type domain-containing protein n=1 Tax=Caenorhabditis bovis TaxID=2654633 RepID=A0A8S1F3H7_9PELO|nr:unnamed protein product [Caenorhabditis bovis]
MFNQLLLLLLLLPLSSALQQLSNIFDNPDECYNGSLIAYPTDDYDIYTVYEETSTCIRAFHREKEEPSRKCPPHLMDFDVQPILKWREDARNVEYVALKVMITSHYRVSSIFYRYECVFAQDGADVYCSTPVRKNPPCRGLNIDSNATMVGTPIRLAYNCFVMTAYSVYRLNATIFPQNCKVSLKVTMPQIRHLFPKGSIQKSDELVWAPGLIVDETDDDAIVIRAFKEKEAPCDTIDVNIYQHTNGSYKFINEYVLECPNLEAIRWENAREGDYIIFASVPLAGCQFSCHDVKTPCVQCVRSQMHITVPFDRRAMIWKLRDTVVDHSLEILVCIALILLLIAVAVSAALLFKWYRDSRIVREIEMDEFVKTMILYSDDCTQHTECVTAAIDCLRGAGKVNALFDVDFIAELGFQPFRWICTAFVEAQKHLIFVSPCTSKYFDADFIAGHQLQQTRPLPDLFRLSIDMIVRECGLNPQLARKRFCIVTFPYFTEIPEQLRTLGLPVFKIPQEFALLTVFLHSFKNAERSNWSIIIPDELSERLDARIEEMRKFCADNPGWQESRWVRREEIAPISIGPPPQMEAGRPADLTDEDRIRISNELGLLPPDSSSEDSESEMNIEVFERSESEAEVENERSEAQGDVDSRPSTSGEIGEGEKIGEKRHKCHQCDYSAKYPSKVRRHAESAHRDSSSGGVRWYECPQARCADKFTTFLEVRRHLADKHPLTHQCPHCKYENKKPAFVRRHIEQMHNNGIPCPILGCEARIAKNRLRKHLKDEHADRGDEIVAKNSTPSVRIARIRCDECDYEPDSCKIGDKSRRDDVEMHRETIHGSGVECPLRCGRRMRIEEIDEHLAGDHADDEPSKSNEPDDSESTAASLATIVGELDFDLC